ncbi:MAG: MarR family transcriptional regulator [Chlorobi bacterium]|nr:MAG: MarR family transcriptional regulator [Bacteroidota bacterium]KXK34509.1 MAG: transcriptional regulator [Chlorobi bacterium OLB6]MBE2264804.1 MarR family transcriptional regulator [Flavobacteriales bacterium]MBL1160805.1 MarR family transcriptional regulator [Chlorobiota bacterium]MBW7852769.1 MarR family transcriptional regulator [Candidatus Kapabacteria bacterium]MCC6330992.1 MarR family transcriptional regulator [Ignavibacteria bacterium]
MGEILRNRLKQKGFDSEHQEALLSLLVAADVLNRKLQQICEQYSITHPQYNVLRILRGSYPNGHPRSEIIARMLQRAPDVTRLINRLEKVGLVCRARTTEDRRLSLTFITPKGIELLNAMHADITSLGTELRERLNVEEAADLIKYCERIIQWDLE